MQLITRSKNMQRRKIKIGHKIMKHRLRQAKKQKNSNEIS